MSQFGKDMVGDDFADKQVVDNLIKEFKIQKNILRKVIGTQNRLIDKLKVWETQINLNFISLRKKIIREINVSKEDEKLVGECFLKLIKIEKNTKINNANINLLELRMDNMDKTIKTSLTTDDLCIVCKEKVLKHIRGMKK